MAYALSIAQIQTEVLTDDYIVHMKAGRMVETEQESLHLTA